MSKEMSIIIIGVWLVALPYLGIPLAWKTFLFILTGLLLMIIGFLMRGETLSRGPKHSLHHPFVESNTTHIVQDYSTHEQKHTEGFTSLN
jgi:sulfite exporter TauE/SafE